jgi:hypothetical protein
MTNARELIDRLGQPPVEVCLDWAWQILDDQPVSARSHVASWENFSVSSAGTLQQYSQETLDTAPLIDQLLEIASRQHDFGPSQAGQISASQRLRLMTEHWRQSQAALGRATFAKSSTDFSHQVDSWSVDDSEDDQSDMAWEESFSSIASRSKNRRIDRPHTVGAKELQQKSTTARSAPRVAWPFSRRSTASIAVAGLLTLGLLVIYPRVFSRNEVARVSKVSESSGQSAKDDLVFATDQVAATGQTEVGQLAEFGQPSSVDQQSLDPDQLSFLSLESRGLSFLASADPSQVERLGGSIAQLDTAQLETAQPEISLDPSVESNKMLKDAATASANDLAFEPNRVSVSDDQDIHRLLGELMAEGEAVMTVQATDHQSSAHGDEVSQPSSIAAGAHLLDIQQSQQVMEVKGKFRVREPVWNLRVATTDEYEVEPATAQRLNEKEMVKWVLRSKEKRRSQKKQPAYVVVQASMLGQRQPSLRWKVAATSADLSSIWIPLDQSKLDRTLAWLQQSGPLMANRIEALKAQIALPGLPREIKGPLSFEKGQLEAQQKLIGRVQEVVAEASLMASGMDRVLEVHGQLTDWAGPTPGPPLVSMGQLEP